MGLFEIINGSLPQGFTYYSPSVFPNPNAVSTSDSFGQRSIDSKNKPTYTPPYKVTKLPNVTGNNYSNPLDRIRYNSKSWGPDFITRGNQFGAVRTADDIERFVKYFVPFSFKAGINASTSATQGITSFGLNVSNFEFQKGDISGLSFILKQNLLSQLFGDKTIYTPLSTLTQIGISLTGISVKKQGLLNRKLKQDGYGIQPDFRENSIKPNSSSNRKSYLSTSPNYQGKGNIEQRINFRSGGTRGNISDYTQGKKIYGSSDETYGALDKINATPLYESEKPLNIKELKDLIDFRIAIINNNSIPGPDNLESTLKNYYLHFRAYIEDFGDSFDAKWKGIDYMGRAEEFYRYSGFKRKISLSFMLVASSKEELLPMYRKLNFLASSLAPSYSENGYMRGNLSKITVGDYLHEQPGFIDNINVTIPDNSPWEINLGLDGEPLPDLRQLPHHLKVKMNFVPIHEFRPEIMKIDFERRNVAGVILDKKGVDDGVVYGNQRFIALKNSTNGTEKSWGKPQSSDTFTNEQDLTSFDQNLS